MKTLLKLLIPLLTILSGTVCSSQLLVHKEITEEKVTQNIPFHVKYSIYNVGNGPVVEVILKDQSFNPGIFMKKGGEFEARFGKIPPHGNVTHVVILKPKSQGVYEIDSAEVSYRSLDDPTAKFRICASSEIGKLQVQPWGIEEKVGYHFKDWLIFAVISLPSIAIPYGLWYNSKKKYDRVFKTHRKMR